MNNKRLKINHLSNPFIYPYQMYKKYTLLPLLGMKLSILLLLVTFLQVNATAYSQQITLKKENAPIEEVFKALRKQSGYNIFYNAEMLKGTGPVTINVVKVSLDEAMNQILMNKALSYKVVDKNILIAKKAKRAEAVEAKDIIVTGRVLDEDGRPLPGVNITVKSSTTRAITDQAGNYRIAIAGNEAVLVFSYLGFAPQERKVTATAVVNISLREQKTGLNEVVVVGYGEVNKRDLTGAVSTVTMKDLEKTPILRVDQMLQGRIAGVDLLSSGGEPGAGTSVRIRGTRSINADNEPLYVIDGIIDAGSLSDINPSDIESIQVLKDASSTAIYGSRGANGVIIINTKKGKPGKDVFSYSADVGIAKLPKYLEMMNAREYAEMANENTLLANPNAPTLPYPDAASLGEGTNWTKEVTRPAVYHNHTLSASGGNTGLRYYFSGNYANQEGIIKGSGFERYQARLNLDKTFSQKLRGGIRLNYSSTVTENNKVDIGSTAGWWNSTLALPPVMNVYYDGGEGQDVYEDWNPGWYSGGVINSPVTLVEMVKNTSFKKNLWTNLFLEYEPVKNLKIKTAFSNTNYFLDVSRYDPGALPRREFLEQGGYAVKQAYRYEKLLSETTISYAKSWNNEHRLNLLGGWTVQKNHSTNQWQRGQGYLVDAVEDNNMQAAEIAATTITSNLDDRQMVSGLGRINYDYKRKYYVTLTGRADGSSNFSRSHKWAFFPSGAVKWALLQEPWMRPLVNTFGDASLRLSYGASGNQAVPSYGSLAKLTASNNGYIFNGVIPVGYYPTNIPNDNLSWETSSQWNAGLDLKLANERVTLTVDAYNTITRDLLLTVQLPQQVGYVSRLMNLGKTRNRGIEFLVNTVNVQTLTGFRWSSSFTFSTNKNEILDLGPLTRVTTETNYAAPQYYMYGYEVGKPVSGLYGVPYAGTWKSAEDIEALRDQYVSTPAFYQPGRQRYVDANNDGVLSEADEVYLGQTEPKFHGGFGNNFSFKGFELDVFFQYSWGAKMYNPLEFKQGTGYLGPNQFKYMVNRWHPVNNPNSDLPRVNSQDFVATDRFVHDASYIRLGSARFGYTFNQRQLPAIGLQNLSLYVTGTNLALWTKYNGYDPDVSNNSSSTVRRKDDGAYPNNRTIAFSISTKF
jgi:TonB-linked SusC/RagA family outer membrane protein